MASHGVTSVSLVASWQRSSELASVLNGRPKAARPAVEARLCAGSIPDDANELASVEDRDASARLEADGAETFEVSQSRRGNLTDWRVGEPTTREQQGRVHQPVELRRR